MAMVSKSLLLSIVPVLLASPILHAAGSGNLEKEYQTIRAVALRDPKVKAAYAEADRKLEAKIAQLDPALANYHSHGSSEPENTSGSTKPATSPTKPATGSKAAPVKGGFHSPHTTPAAATTSAHGAPAAGAKHTIAPGDTLGAIASHYGVTVAALKSANPAVDEKKLIIGEVLTIPAKKTR